MFDTYSLQHRNYTHAIGGRPEEVLLRIKDHGGDPKFISAETACQLQFLEMAQFILHCSKLTHQVKVCKHSKAQASTGHRADPKIKLRVPSFPGAGAENAVWERDTANSQEPTHVHSGGR